MSEQNLIEWLGELLIKSAIIIAIGFILTSVFRSWAPDWKHRLWMRVFATALFIPFVLTLPRIELIPIRATKGVVDSPGPLSVDTLLSKSTASTQGASQQETSNASVVSWQRIVLFIWLFGSFTLLLRTVVASVRLQRLCSRASEPVEELQALFRHLRQKAGLSTVSLSLSDEIDSPFTWGIMKPRVLLPASANTWNAFELEMILVHELEHVKRCDSISVLVSRVFLILNWVNPLAWVAIRQSVRFREEACDLQVLSVGYEAPDYAEMLFRQAKKANARILQTCATAMAETGTIEKRIQMILKPHNQNIRPSHFPSGTRVAIFSITVLFLLIGFAGSQTKEAESAIFTDLEAIATIEKKLKTIILPSVDFSDLPFKDALAFLQQKSVELDVAETNPEKRGVKFVWDSAEGPVTANPKITIRVVNIPLIEALRYTTIIAQARSVVEPHRVVVKPRTPSQTEALLTKKYTVPKGFTQVDGKELTAKEVLERAGVKFGKGALAIINSSNESLVIRNTQKQMDHTEAFLDALMEGKRKEFLKKIAAGWEKPTLIEEKISSIIIPKVEFQETPFKDAIAFLRQRSVELDTKEKDPFKKGINIIMHSEVESAAPITIRLTNVPLGKALRHTAALAGFSSTVEDHAVIIRPGDKK